MDDEQRKFDEDATPLSRFDREVLRTYAGRGNVSPLDTGDMSRSKEYAKEMKDIKGARRWMFVKGYVALLVIVVMSGFIIWQVYIWSNQAFQGRSLLDRARSGTEKANPLTTE